jgi:hypothetical protein
MEGGDPEIEQYRYLEDNYLCRDFDECVEDSVSSCKVHICIFSMDSSSCTMPFLKFRVHDESIVEFPSFQYDIPDKDSTEDFKCQVFEKFITELSLSIPFQCSSIPQVLDSLYRGIKYIKIEGVDHVFAFFDYDAISSFGTPSKGTWAIVDELLFERKMYGVKSVDNAIPTVFANDPLLWNILDKNNNWIDFPFSVYAVKTKEEADGKEVFVNLFGEEEEEEIDCYGKEDEFGNRFCFSCEPLHHNLEGLKRYAAFTSHPVYLDDNSVTILDQANISSEELDDSLIQQLEIPVIYLTVNNEHTNNTPISMWGIKPENLFVHL